MPASLLMSLSKRASVLDATASKFLVNSLCLTHLHVWHTWTLSAQPALVDDILGVSWPGICYCADIAFDHVRIVSLCSYARGRTQSQLVANYKTTFSLLVVRVHTNLIFISGKRRFFNFIMQFILRQTRIRRR